MGKYQYDIDDLFDFLPAFCGLERFGATVGACLRQQNPPCTIMALFDNYRITLN